MTDEHEHERDRERGRVDTSHLDGIEDGCGCAEVWEHLSEDRDSAADAGRNADPGGGDEEGTDAERDVGGSAAAVDAGES